MIDLKYRVLMQVIPTPRRIKFSIRQTFYDEDNEVYLIADKPLELIGDTIDELIEYDGILKEALTHPVIDENYRELSINVIRDEIRFNQRIHKERRRDIQNE